MNQEYLHFLTEVDMYQIFFVLDTNVWIEIKPTPPTAVEQRKMQEVALKSNQVGIIFFGSFSESVYGNIYLPTTSYSLFSHSFRNLFENLDLIQNEFTFASLLDTSCDSIHQAMNSCCVDWEDIESSLENMNVCPQTYLEGRTSKRPQGIIDPAAFWQDLPASVRVESLAPILKNPKQV